LINVKHVLRFLPHYTANTGFVKYFRPEFENFEKANQETDFALIRNALIKATQKD
jgi:asparagine synthase (glutamine-hydrolysing)